jgi:hypothetical protein
MKHWPPGVQDRIVRIWEDRSTNKMIRMSDKAVIKLEDACLIRKVADVLAQLGYVSQQK